MYYEPNSQYSQLVMALRKAETETLGSSVSEVKGKSAVVGEDTTSQAKGVSPEPSYKALTQQIGYLMSGITNSNNQNLNKNGVSNGFKSNGNGKPPSTIFQRPKRDKKSMKCWGCGGLGHSWGECSTPRQGHNLAFRPNQLNQNPGNGQHLNDKQGEETQSPNHLLVMTRKESTSMEN